MSRTPKSRAALLAAAESVFARKGLAGARTEEIARLAGANKAMVHYYFSTKERLFEAVLHSLLAQFRELVLEPVRVAPTPAVALFLFVERHVEFLAAHPNFPRIIQREMMTGGPRMHDLIERFQGPLSMTLRRILRAGIRRGEFRRVDADQMLVSLASLTVFYFIIAPVIQILMQTDPLSRRLVTRRKRAIFDLLTQGLLTEKGRKQINAVKGRKR